MDEKMKLLFNAFVKFLFGLALCILLVFLPAGSLKFLNGWIFIADLFIPMLALACFAFYPIFIVFRIIDEEKLLKSELKGYNEYTQKVKYRLIPFVW